MATAKFKALTHFIVHECRDNPSRLGAIRLNKALFKTDVAAFKERGTTVTGDSYVKRQMGPVPKHILATLRELKDEGSLAIQEPQYRYDARRFLSLTSPNVDSLSADEKSLARAAIASVCGMSVTAVSDETHDLIWKAASEGEEIPIRATLASQEGVVTEAVLEWAEASIAQREAA